MTLRFKFAQGDKLTYDLSTTNIANVDNSGKTRLITVKQSAVAAVEVTAATAAGFTTTTSMTHVKVDAGKDPHAAQMEQEETTGVEGLSISASYDSLGQKQSGGSQSQNALVNMLGGAMGRPPVGMMGVVFPEMPVEGGIDLGCDHRRRRNDERESEGVGQERGPSPRHIHAQEDQVVGRQESGGDRSVG